MSAPSVIRLPATLDSLQPLMAFVLSQAEGAGFGQARRSEIELVLEELLVNIFSYAYPGGRGDVTVECAPSGTGGLAIEITDEGLPFDPLAREDPDLDAGVEERGIGGLGVFFVKQLVQGIHYRREGGKNILSLQVDAGTVFQ